MKKIIYILIKKSITWKPGQLKKIFIFVLQNLFKKLSSISFKEEMVVYSKINDISVKYLVEGKNFIEDKLIKNGIHSEYIIKEILNNYEDNSIIFDVGANIGTISLPLAKSLNSKNVDIVACEASEIIYKKLSKNIKINNLKNIFSIHKAIYSSLSTIELNEQKSNSKNQGLSSIYQNSDLEDFSKISIDTDTIDNIVQRMDLKKKVSVIKIDIQGPEYEVLLGAVNTLERYKPVLIFEHEDEYHSNPREQKLKIKKYLEKLGYRIFLLNPKLENTRPSIKYDKYLNSNLIAFHIK